MRTRIALAMLGAVLVLAAGCSSTDEPGLSPAEPETGSGETTVAADESAPSGGVFRIGVESSFGFTNAFDPTGEYLLEAFSLYRNLLLRTLVGYRHVAGAEGNELVPDLAALPEITDGGKTWTFRLKDGIRFGPPVAREITSADVAYAFERIGTPALAAQYGFYYDVIAGMDAFRAGETDTISGIVTPDDKTIVFHLTAPTGDFGHRVAMPAAAPIPREIATCFTQPGEYGRYLIASGPYMLEGSEALDATSCDTLEPITGFDQSTSMSLVRNPEYDPATDDPSARRALPDGFVLEIDSNVDAIFGKLARGELEGEWASLPPKILREYAESDEKRELLKVNAADAIAYVTLNLTQPPFDDVHVRRAINLAMDKDGLRRAWGGPLNGGIATHVLPSAMLHGKLDQYDPYPTPDFAGDVEGAKAEMRQSRYDTDGDGMCDTTACEGVLVLSAPAETPAAMEPVVQDSLARIGIDAEIRVSADPFTALGTVRKAIPLSPLTSWAKDYADPSTFMVLFDGRSIIPTGNTNLSLVGLTTAVAQKSGLEGAIENVPSVNGSIDRCSKLLDNARLECYAELDRTLMEDIVPWVPYLDRANLDILGPAVAAWSYDQSSTIAGYAHVAVDVTKQKGL